MFWEGGWEWARLIGSYDTLGQPLTSIGQPLTSIGQPLTSIGQTPRFYQPDTSLLSPGQAAPCRTVSATVATQPVPACQSPHARH